MGLRGVNENNNNTNDKENFEERKKIKVTWKRVWWTAAVGYLGFKGGRLSVVHPNCLTQFKILIQHWFKITSN